MPDSVEVLRVPLTPERPLAFAIMDSSLTQRFLPARTEFAPSRMGVSRG